MSGGGGGRAELKPKQGHAAPGNLYRICITAFLGFFLPGKWVREIKVNNIFKPFFLFSTFCYYF